MPTVHRFRSLDAVEVSFALDRPDAHEVAVAVGSRGWCQIPMRRYPRDTGPFTITLRLPAGRPVEYRYLVDGHHWVDDPSADAHLPNGLGGTNSVIDLGRQD